MPRAPFHAAVRFAVPGEDVAVADECLTCAAGDGRIQLSLVPSLDKIMGYATPVLAERAHIAERAQRASVRRKAGEGSSRMLGDAVADQLRSRNVDPESVAWDAWRREDGRWTLVADYRAAV